MCGSGLEGVEFFAGLESDRFAWGNAYFSARAGIAANTGFARADAEDTKSAQFDALACRESLFQTLEDRVDCGLGLSSGQTSALDHVMDNVLLNQREPRCTMGESTASYPCDTTGFAANGKLGLFLLPGFGVLSGPDRPER